MTSLRWIEKPKNLMHGTAWLIACKHAQACNRDLPCAKRQGDKPKEVVENDTRNLANGDALQIWTVLKQC
jgi:hypothetical protein